MNNEIIYRKLQRHLDRQPVGFPSTLNGSDIALLKHHFQPEEARIALSMSYRYETAEIILNRFNEGSCQDQPLTLESLSETLDNMSRNISIMRNERKGIISYCLMPLVIGMYEGQVFEIDLNYINLFSKYANSLSHGVSLISTSLPQMRTVPVEKSIEKISHQMPYDNLSHIINSHEGKIAIIECICRKKRSLMGEPCLQTKRSETCMVFGDVADLLLKFHRGREITPEEALVLTRESQKEGLVLQASNMIEPEVICSCCSCCCGLLGIQHMLPNAAIFTASAYYAAIDPEICTSCGLCVKKCNVKAVKIKKNKPALVIQRKCIGCGQCVAVCRPGAAKLIPRKNISSPPDNFESLQDQIMKNKPWWRLGRVLYRTLFRF